MERDFKKEDQTFKNLYIYLRDTIWRRLIKIKFRRRPLCMKIYKY